MQIMLALEFRATPLAQNCSSREGAGCSSVGTAAPRRDRFTDEQELAKAGAQMSTFFCAA